MVSARPALLADFISPTDIPLPLVQAWLQIWNASQMPSNRTTPPCPKSPGPGCGAPRNKPWCQARRNRLNGGLHPLAPSLLPRPGIPQTGRFYPPFQHFGHCRSDARESRPDIINFVRARHATVFEGVKTGDESSKFIQKMIVLPFSPATRSWE
jgi:hypothetical protein